MVRHKSRPIRLLYIVITDAVLLVIPIILIWRAIHDETVSLAYFGYWFAAMGALSMWKNTRKLFDYIADDLYRLFLRHVFARLTYKVALDVPAEAFESPDWEEAVVWAEEHVPHLWLRRYDEFYFASLSDATYFKLRWCGN